MMKNFRTKGDFLFPDSVPHAACVSFKTGMEQYVFAANTGQIFLYPDSLNSAVETIPPDSSDIRRYGELATLCIDSIEPGCSFDEARAAIQHDLGHIIFGVTQDCNLRCRYCVFSGEFEHYRKHTPAAMTEATALKAADYFLGHLSARKKMVFATFYGGEPFLNLPVIKRVHAYLKKALKDRIFFSITTNGTLLHHEAREFVVANRIHLSVSIDGDKATHNRNRKFVNGKPTFDKIIRNLECLKMEDETYFNQFVDFTVTVTKGCNYKQLDDFFSNYRNTIKISPVMFYGSRNIEQVMGTTSNMDYLIEKFIEGCLNHAFEDSERRWKYLFAFGVLGRGLSMVHNRRVSDTPLFDDTYYLTKHCIPGASKLFVFSDGTFFPCERLDSYSHLAIGNIEHGVCASTSYHCLQDYAVLRNTYCMDCYLIDICDYCLQSASNGSGWDEQKMRFQCDLARRDFMGVLKLYAHILERDSTALDFMEKSRATDFQKMYFNK